jgi:hypothetical protein
LAPLGVPATVDSERVDSDVLVAAVGRRGQAVLLHRRIGWPAATRFMPGAALQVADAIKKTDAATVSV